MRLWLLKPLPSSELWKGSGRCWGMVIRAENALAARVLASMRAGDETMASYRRWRSEPERYTEGLSPWTMPTETSCEELGCEGPQEIVLQDFGER